MSALRIVSRPARFSPMGNPIPASLTEQLATRTAITRGLIGPQGHLAELPGSVQHALREDARLAIQLAARGPKDTMLMHLRRSLANEMFGDELTGIKFDELKMHEREEVAAAAAVALGTMLDVLAGTAAAIPAWEEACLNFEGPYDPALLVTTETVQQVEPLTAEFVAMIAKRNGVPDGLMEGLGGYVALGHRPGHFLTAVLENNLIEAVRRADPMSSAGLVALAVLVDNSLPAACHGSPKRVAAWIAHGGMRQFETADKAGV